MVKRLLVIDVGNTNIVLGVYQGSNLECHWRIRSEHNYTVDEYTVLIKSLFNGHGLTLSDINDVIISCVVPPMLVALEDFCRFECNSVPLIVGPGIKTGMPILYDNPREVGADRIVNSVAAYEAHKRALIVVDFGTATTFDAVSSKGEYLGGVISPGIMISAEALFRKASKLPRVEIFARPKSIIAKDTVNSMNAGIIFGFSAMVDGIVERMKAEMEHPPMVVATGGLAKLMMSESKTIEREEPNLTLEGLRIIYERNR
jgi:type III pantothenate kinase